MTAVDPDFEALVTAELSGDEEAAEQLAGDLHAWLAALERRRRALMDRLTRLKPEREKWIEDRAERAQHVEQIERTRAELILRERALAERERAVRNLIRCGPITTTDDALSALRDALGNAVMAVNVLIELHGGPA